jgi:hypothetical protein
MFTMLGNETILICCNGGKLRGIIRKNQFIKDHM